MKELLNLEPFNFTTWEGAIQFKQTMRTIDPKLEIRGPSFRGDCYVVYVEADATEERKENPMDDYEKEYREDLLELEAQRYEEEQYALYEAQLEAQDRDYRFHAAETYEEGDE